MTARHPIQTVDYAGVKGTPVDANWVGPAGTPYQAIAALAVLLAAVLLLISPAVIGLLAVADAQVLDRLVPWVQSAGRLFALLDIGRGLFFLLVAGLVLTARGDA